MKSKTLLSALVIASMGLGSLSFAQGWDRGERHGDRYEQRREERHDQRYDQRYDQRRDTRAMGNRGDWREHGPQARYDYGARGPGWHRGGYLPREYRNHQYVVDNWRAHRLAPPPRGYQWVQVGNDYVLAAVATGLIANLILNSAY